MPMWRVTKYNPAARDAQGRYMIDDWISVSDMGRSFNGVRLTIEEYLRVENAYVNAAIRFLKETGLSELSVQGMEVRIPVVEEITHFHLDTLLYNSDIMYDGQIITIDEIVNACRLNLRELLWCRLEKSNTFYIHFGYDYYMYIGSICLCKKAISFAVANGLHIEEMASPYSMNFFSG